MNSENREIIIARLALLAARASTSALTFKDIIAEVDALAELFEPSVKDRMRMLKQTAIQEAHDKHAAEEAEPVAHAECGMDDVLPGITLTRLHREYAGNIPVRAVYNALGYKFMKGVARARVIGFMERRGYYMVHTRSCHMFKKL